MKRVALSALIVLGIFLLLFLLLIGGFKYRTEYAKTEVETYYSDDHDYKLAIYQIGEPQFPFGPGKCRFVLTKDDKKINGIDILLLNDGKWPHPENLVSHGLRIMLRSLLVVKNRKISLTYCIMMEEKIQNSHSRVQTSD